jgi:hypothetical protein
MLRVLLRSNHYRLHNGQKMNDAVVIENFAISCMHGSKWIELVHCNRALRKSCEKKWKSDEMTGSKYIGCECIDLFAFSRKRALSAFHLFSLQSLRPVEAFCMRLV